MRFQTSKLFLHNVQLNWFKIYMYLTSTINLARINPLETVGLGEIMHIFAVSMRM